MPRAISLGYRAERDGARLVLADGLEHLAERRVDRAIDDEEPEEKDREHREVHRVGVLEIEDAEQRATGHRLDAVLAAGELRLDGEEVDHLRERERAGSA